jgi:hypothetical protein
MFLISLEPVAILSRSTLRGIIHAGGARFV